VLHCSIELSSIVLKVIAELLINCGICEGVDDLPIQLSSLLDRACDKSDTSVEQEIY
jgi:hypothetical protein